MRSLTLIGETVGAFLLAHKEWKRVVRVVAVYNKEGNRMAQCRGAAMRQMYSYYDQMKSHKALIDGFRGVENGQRQT